MVSVQFRNSLIVLAGHEVELVVVGVLSAVMQGAPVTTFDVDVVHRRTTENVERLLLALADLDAIYRGDERRLRPTASHLIGPSLAPSIASAPSTASAPTKTRCPTQWSSRWLKVIRFVR